MSLDKYLMRGFTGSLGSGTGKWVATSTPPPQNTPPQHSSNHDRGSSFVLGGSPSARSGRSHSHSQNYKEDRYSFDSERVRDSGTVQDRHSYKECFQATSLSDGLTSKVGHRVLLSLCLYGIALGLTIYVIFAYFGNDNTEHWYSTPDNLPRHARPLWDRHR